MDTSNPRALKDSASFRLSQATYPPRNLVLIHTGISLGAALVLALIQYYLETQIGSTGGLSGMGLRSVLETAQLTLQYALSIAMPFWNIGFIYVALQISKGEQATPKSLLEGFRRFGPVLRLQLLRGLVYFGVAIACIYASSFIFALTPLSAPLMDVFMPLMETASTMEELQLAVGQIPFNEMAQLIWPVLIIFGVLFGALAVLLFYRFRMADFVMMDRPNTSGLQALLFSGRMTRHHRMELFRLDLSFWWFYLLTALSMVASYADVILQYIAVELPVSPTVAWFGAYILGMLVQLLVYWKYYSYVKTTLAVAYEGLLQQMPEFPMPQPQPAPKKLPWDDYETK